MCLYTYYVTYSSINLLKEIWTIMVATYFSFVAHPWAIGKLYVYDKIEEPCRYFGNLVKIIKKFVLSLEWAAVLSHRGAFYKLFGGRKKSPGFLNFYLCVQPTEVKHMNYQSTVTIFDYKTLSLSFSDDLPACCIKVQENDFSFAANVYK